MAGPFAIAAVGRTILSLLAAAVPRQEFATASFELYQTKNLQQPMEEGVALYLHRVTAANGIRNLPPRVDPDGHRYRPSLPIDLHFLVIAWAREAVKQQRLLGLVMRTLEDTPLLHASLLNQHGPENDTFAANESVDLVLETIPVQDLGTIWDAAKTQTQPCAAYVARMLALDSSLEMVEAGRTQTRVFGVGEVANP